MSYETSPQGPLTRTVHARELAQFEGTRPFDSNQLEYSRQLHRVLSKKGTFYADRLGVLTICRKIPVGVTVA